MQRCPDDTRRAPQPKRWPNGMPESNLCELRGKKPAKPSIINDKTICGLHARGCAHANFGERAAGRIMRECRMLMMPNSLMMRFLARGISRSCRSDEALKECIGGDIDLAKQIFADVRSG